MPVELASVAETSRRTGLARKEHVGVEDRRELGWHVVDQVELNPLTVGVVARIIRQPGDRRQRALFGVDWDRDAHRHGVGAGGLCGQRRTDRLRRHARLVDDHVDQARRGDEARSVVPGESSGRSASVAQVESARSGHAGEARRLTIERYKPQRRRDGVGRRGVVPEGNPSGPIIGGAQGVGVGKLKHRRAGVSAELGLHGVEALDLTLCRSRARLVVDSQLDPGEGTKGLGGADAEADGAPTVGCAGAPSLLRSVMLVITGGTSSLSSSAKVSAKPML